ncbi:histidine--tRNA ligase [Buchnera aphidicola]|uniref:histidine--tRNA ligase n=1 Tax=Buchnera aphidicola TaxID=9 RepID=UPI003464929B
MKDIFQSVKGMHDYLPKELILWNKVENILKEILFNYSYFEIRLPIVENTILFKKSMGSMTDIIGKEMYSFNDKNGNNLTLRPEATVGCVRSMIQNQLLYHKKQKLWYYGPMFRYERPQKGRYRQFFQFGIETFGFLEPEIELEVIILINKFLKKLNISDYVFLEINSIGSLASRKKYQNILKHFLYKHIDLLDNHCINQLHNNSLRILDSKSTKIQNILKKSPILMDFITSQERIHFQKLCNLMDSFNIQYIINPRLVRGLDYYNNTVFEWKTNFLGSKNTICAGGRYDTLVENLGGPQTPAMGLAIGMERLLLLLKSLSIFNEKNIMIDIYILLDSEEIKLFAIDLSENIRNNFPMLKTFLEFQPVNFNKIFKNIKKYNTNILLLLEKNKIKNNLIRFYNFINKENCIVHINNLIKKIHSDYFDKYNRK